MAEMYEGQIVTPELAMLINKKNKALASAQGSYKSASGANAWDRAEDKYKSDVSNYKKNKALAESTDKEISALLANLKTVGEANTTVGARKQTSVLTSGLRETSVLTSLL